MIAELRGVSIAFDDDVVVRDVDLTVEAGERVALVGASGSGKSSLLLVLAGLLRPTAGTACVSGEPLDLDRPEAVARLRRDEIGVVFQFGELVPDLTLLENVALPLRLAGWTRRRAEARASERLEDLGVGGAAGRVADEASGGQVQRAAIARALIGDPSLVLADEPTGSLGPEHSDAVADLLFDGARRQGAALVLATHEAGLAQRADRVLAIHGGRLIETRAAGEAR